MAINFVDKTFPRNCFQEFFYELSFRKTYLKYVYFLLGSQPRSKIVYLLFIFSNVLFLNVPYFKTIWFIMHDVFNNVTPIKIHHHNTRFSVASNFYLQYSRTDYMKNSF